jgi:hypothetical protein
MNYLMLAGINSIRAIPMNPRVFFPVCRIRPSTRTKTRNISFGQKILIITLLFLTAVGVQAESNVFDPTSQLLSVSCIRNTGYGQNGFPPGFALTAVRDDRGKRW